MDTMSAKNFLQNTEVKFKVKMIATIIPAAIFLITILIEGITGTGIQIMQNIYLISGLILLVATGAVVKLLKIALTAFKWGWLLTPFTLFDLVIAVIAGGFVPIWPYGTGYLGSLYGTSQCESVSVIFSGF